MQHKLLSASLLLLMFIISGLDKVKTMGSSESTRLMKRIPFLNATMAKNLVLLAGIWELVSCAAILHSLWVKDESSRRIQLVRYGCYSLLVFTVIVTLVFYVNPIQKYPLLSNLTTVCALILLPEVCSIFDRKVTS